MYDIYLICLLDQDLHSHVQKPRLAHLAQKGLRGELVFPVPYVLRTKPSLLGYYRLLLGFSQKEFYKRDYAKFKVLEGESRVTNSTNPLIEELCRSLIESSWLLVSGLPVLSSEIINALTLLTLGPQFRGSRNVSLGANAIQIVFALIANATKAYLIEQNSSYLKVRNLANRIYRVELSPDPDIAIRQELNDGSYRNKIAIEVKGGTDYSNIHNRLGKAEKSHQKAKADGFIQFWTVINVSGVLRKIWATETPTTTEVFNLEEIAEYDNPEY